MLSSVYRLEEKYDSALIYLNQSEAIFDSLYHTDKSSDSTTHLDGLAETYNYKGWVFNESGRSKEGTPFLEKALSINKKSEIP